MIPSLPARILVLLVFGATVAAERPADARMRADGDCSRGPNQAGGPEGLRCTSNQAVPTAAILGP